MASVAWTSPGSHSFTLPDDAGDLIGISVSGAGIGASTVSVAAPAAPGDEISVIVGAPAIPGAGAGGYGGGGNGAGGTNWDGFAYTAWTTAGGGASRLSINGVLAVVAGGAAGPAAQLSTPTGPTNPFDPHSGETQVIVQGGGVPTGDALLVDTLPGPGDPNRAPLDTYTSPSPTPGIRDILDTPGATGTETDGGGSRTSGASLDVVDYTFHSGAGGGGYGGGASGGLFASSSPSVPAGTVQGASGRVGTSYSAHDDAVLSTAFAASATIVYNRRPVAVITASSRWNPDDGDLFVSGDQSHDPELDDLYPDLEVDERAAMLYRFEWQLRSPEDTLVWYDPVTGSPYTSIPTSDYPAGRYKLRLRVCDIVDSDPFHLWSEWAEHDLTISRGGFDWMVGSIVSPFW